MAEHCRALFDASFGNPAARLTPAAGRRYRLPGVRFAWRRALGGNLNIARLCARAAVSSGVLLSCPAVPGCLVVASAVMLVGCQDENQPEYWVRKLESAAWRARAVKRLEQFFEDTATRSAQDPEHPELVALRNTVVSPLTAAYTDHRAELDDKTRLRLIQLLASLRDARAEPAFLKALASFGSATGNAQEARWAARAVAELNLSAAEAPLLAAFGRLQVSTKEGRAIAPHFNKALRTMAPPSWVPTLTKALAPAMDLPRPGEGDPGRLNDYQNQLFWQTTAVQVLGEIGDASAVEPLLRVLLDPGKGGVHRPALLALVKLGAPAVRAASDLLVGKSPELEAFARSAQTRRNREPAAQSHVRAAAVVLGAVGSADCRAPLLLALAGEETQTNRAILARELTNVPANAESLRAFRRTFEGFAPGVTVPPGTPVRPMMAEAAAHFFEPSLVPWLLRQSKRARREPGTRTALLLTAVTLAGPGQLKAVEKAVESYDGAAPKRALKAVRSLVEGCQRSSACYLKGLTESSGPEPALAAIKSASMLAIVGDLETRDRIVQQFGKIASPALRFAAVTAIDHLSPTRSAATADALQALVDKNALGADPQRMLADAPVQHVVYRLRSR